MDLPKAIIFELFDNPNADTTDVVRNAHFAQCRYVSGLVDEAFAVESCLFRLVFMRLNIIFANGGAVHLNGGPV